MNSPCSWKSVFLLLIIRRKLEAGLLLMMMGMWRLLVVGGNGTCVIGAIIADYILVSAATATCTARKIV